jgi:hypothetical protein
MKRAYYLMITVALLATVIFNSCKKDTAPDPNQPKITLSSERLTGKSGQELEVTVSITAPNGLSALLITKGVNLKPASTFGTGGVLKVAGSGNTLTYVFKYTLLPEEVDKLVGFNFRAEDSKGLASEKDFTLNTTVSAEQLLYSYKWNLKSKMWQKNPPAEDITDCEKDDAFLFNRDKTMALNYGASACTFDGFNVYTQWNLSADEKELTITYHSLFNPAQVTNDKYRVISLTKEKLVMDMTFDLTAFGYTDHELFVFTYEASGR